MKCDRLHPCTPCSKRHDAESCSYPIFAKDKREPPGEGPRGNEVQLRLQKLEEMITTLMQNPKGTSKTSNDTHSVRDVTMSRSSESLSAHGPSPTEANIGGHLETNGPETNYLGATHWETILEHVGNQFLIATDILGQRHARFHGTWNR